MGWANQRIQKQIMMKVSAMLQRDLQDPRLGFVTITKAELTKDRLECKIFWSSLEEGGARSAVAHALDDAQGYIQREVAGMLHLRSAPQLSFHFDPTLEGIERLSRILKQAREEDEASARERTASDEAAEEEDSTLPPES